MLLGIPSFEIVWNDPNDYFRGLVPENQLIFNSKISHEKLWSTIEPQILVEKAYPELVETFRKSRIKPSKPSKRRNGQIESENKRNVSISAPSAKKNKTTKSVKRNINEIENLENSLKQLEVVEAKTKVTTLQNFLKTAVLNNHKKHLDENEINKMYFNANILQTSTPSKPKQNVGMNMNWSSFCDEEDKYDDDLSEIIEGIVSRKPVITNFQEINLLNPETSVTSSNHSSFFVNNLIANDLFEKTFNEIVQIDTDESTEEYELDETDNIMGIQDIQNSRDVEINDLPLKEVYDSFIGLDIDLPLKERLKKQML